MADILSFTLINTKIAPFCEKLHPIILVFGRFFASLGRFVADNRCFFHQKSTYFAATITVIIVVPLHCQRCTIQWNNCYIDHGTTVSPIDNNCFIRSKQLFHSMFAAIPFKVIVYHCVVLQPPSVAQSVESLYICGA